MHKTVSKVLKTQCFSHSAFWSTCQWGGGGLQPPSHATAHWKCECNLAKIMVQVQILSPTSREDKKSLHRKLKFLSPKSSESLKKKGFSALWDHTSFGRKLWDSFVLTGTFSSDHPALKSQWGKLTLEGGTYPPYNLSTDY